MKTLVILAAGMGSRFGGLKQIAPLGPNGEFIIDYSIHDAIKAGFEKVVFIIKEENFEIFKSTIGKRVEDKIKVEYAFQKNDIDVVPKERIKPLGTAHAILCAEKYIDDTFMIINADDYYGIDAYQKGSEYLDIIEDNTFGLVGYHAANTMTENGSVKRGICKSENGYLTSIIESKIEYVDGKIVASPLSGDNSFEIDASELVSMNMFLFNKSLFKFLHQELETFLKTADLANDEYLLPNVVDKYIKDGSIKVKVLSTTSVWYGVTYKEDTDFVKENLKSLHENGTYRKALWDE